MNPAAIQNLITAHKSQNDTLTDWWNRWMECYRGDYWGALSVPQRGTDDEVAVDTNYTYAFLDSMVAGVVPAHPAASITVRHPALQDSRRAREALVNSTFRRNDLAKKLRRCAGLSAICGTSYLKASWEPAGQRVVFTPRDRRYVWVDPDAAEWEDVRYLIEAVPLTEDQFKARVERKGGYNKEVADKAAPDAFPTWGRADGEYDYKRDAISSTFRWVVVYEVYDFVTGEYTHALEDVSEPLLHAKLPYVFLRNRFRPITFNDSLANTFGVSDIGLIYRLQMMLNELDTLQLQFVQACIPVPMFNSAATDEADRVGDDLAAASGPRDMIDVPLKQGHRMQDVLMFTQTPPLNPEHASVRAGVMSAIENLLALPSFRRGEVGQAHIATEVAAAMAALQTRNGRRVAEIHSVMEWCARATMALTEEMMGDKQVVYAATAQDETVEITRRALRAMDPKGASAWWDDSYFTYKISSYNTPDDSLPVQLRSLSQFLPTLISLPEVKRYALVEKLVEMLNINPAEVLWPPEKLQQMSEAASQAALQAQAAAGGGAGVGGVAGWGQPAMLDGKAPDGRMIPNGDAVAQAGVGAGGDVDALGPGATTPPALPGMAGGPGIGV